MRSSKIPKRDARLIGSNRVDPTYVWACVQCIQLPCPAAAAALAGKGKVRLTAGKGREEK
jgi:hypothetical protein